LESLIESKTDTKTGKKINPVIKDYDDMSKDTSIDFTITLQKGKMEELNSEGIYKQFKLVSTISTSNMHLFDAEDKLKKYNTIPEIIDDYYVKRLEMYEIRKTYLINEIKRELMVLNNKARYIKEILEGTIDLRKKTKDVINNMLREKGYHEIKEGDEYKYLTKMPMDSVTEENVKKLLEEEQKMIKELEELESTTKEDMWLKELNELNHEYILFREEKERMMDNSSLEVKKGKKKSTKTPK
jgi:DNA topoisomerase-2